MKINNFIKTDNGLINVSKIIYIDTSLVEELKIEIKSSDEYGNIIKDVATNLNAIEILMELKPSCLEGKNLKWMKNKWIVHNLIAHPLMQILCFFKCYKLAIKLHDNTVPKPLNIIKKIKNK